MNYKGENNTWHFSFTFTVVWRAIFCLSVLIVRLLIFLRMQETVAIINNCEFAASLLQNQNSINSSWWLGAVRLCGGSWHSSWHRRGMGWSDLRVYLVRIEESWWGSEHTWPHWLSAEKQEKARGFSNFCALFDNVPKNQGESCVKSDMIWIIWRMIYCAHFQSLAYNTWRYYKTSHAVMWK